MTSMTNMLLDLESKDPKLRVLELRSWGSEQNNKDEYIKVSSWIDHF